MLPEDCKNNLRVAGERHATGQYGPTVALLKPVLKANPQHREALFLRGDALRRLGRLTKAEKDLSLAASLGSYEALASRAWVYSETSRPQQALLDVRQAAAHIGKTALVRAGEAHALYRCGENILALKKANKAATYFPGSGDAWTTLAEIRTTFEKYDEAREAFARAQQLRPTDPYIAASAAFVSNNAYVAKRDPAALVAATEMIALSSQIAPGNPYAATAKANLAAVRLGLGECLFLAEEALASEPRYVRAINEKIGALLGMGRISEARPLVEEAMATRPGMLNTWLSAVRLFLNSRDFEQALDAATKACDLSGNRPHDLALKGRVLRKLERFEEARAVLDEALSQDANHLLALAEKFELCSEQKEWREALGCAMLGYANAPSHSKRLVQIAKALLGLEMPNEALQIADKFLDSSVTDRSDDDTNYTYITRAIAKRDLGLYAEALLDLKLIPHDFHLKDLARALKTEVEKLKILAERGLHANATVGTMRTLLGRNDFVATIVTADSYLSAHPDDVDALAIKAKALINLGAYQAAKRCITQARKNIDADAEPHPLVLNVEAELLNRSGSWWNSFVLRCRDMMLVGGGISTSAKLLSVFV